MVDTLDSNAMNISMTRLNPMDANETEVYGSIDSGIKDEFNFDEIITFNHTYLKFRIFDTLSSKVEEFPFLTNNEYLLVGNSTFDEKSLSSMNNKEILQLVKSRVQSYINDGDITFKSLFLDNLSNYAIEIGFESTVDLLLPLIIKISEEKDSVKIKFLHNLKSFLQYLNKNGEEGYKIIRDQIIPVLNEIFQDKKNLKVIDLCCDALVEITKYIKEEEKGYHILTIVIVMAHDDSDEESRVLAAKLFNQLALIIGRELCELYVVPQIASFADDPHSKVRKAVAGNFLNMCMSVSEASFKSKLLPVYQKLSKDSLWIVRKAATEILPKITSLCDSETISTTLLEIFRNFTNDNQKYVRIAAIEVLGQFIALLKKEDLSESILEFYINIVDEFYSNKDSNTNESDIIYHCAYNFPAILFTFGKDSWKDLQKIYFRMASDRDYRVRNSIASSLYEIGKIIGPELTETELIPVFDRLSREEGDMQNTLLRILPNFLKDLSKATRRTYLEKLKRLLNPKEKWRTRMEFSSIIGEYDSVFDDEITYKQILPISLYFCVDDVAEVRITAARNCSKIITQLLSNESKYKLKCLKIMDAFGYSLNYNYRQLFVLMCTDVFSNENVSRTLIMKYLKNLLFDRVVNVRVTLAKVISNLFKEKKYNWIFQNNDLMCIAYKLKKDSNKNVNSHFIGIEEIKEAYFEEDTETASNNLFVDKMSILKDEFGITKNLPLNAKIRGPEIESIKSQSVSTRTELKSSLNNISEEYNELAPEKSIQIETVEQTKDSSGMDVDSLQSINHIEVDSLQSISHIEDDSLKSINHMEDEDHLGEVDKIENNTLNSEDI